MRVISVTGGRYNGHIAAARIPDGQVHFTRLTGAIDLPATVIHDEPIYDQGQAGSCVAFAYGGCAESSARWNGKPSERVSARAAYALIRAFMIGDPSVPLTDTGCDPAAAVDALRKYGVMAERDYPYTDDPTGGLHDRLEEDALEQSAVARLDAFAPITSTGPDRCLAIRRCIAAKVPVALAMPIDQSFEDWRSDAAYDHATGASLGRHAMRVSGMRPGAFLLTNQWGLGWGLSGDLSGRIWVSDRCIGEDAFDAAALTWAPTVARSA